MGARSYWEDRTGIVLKPLEESLKDICKDREKALTYTKPCPNCRTIQVQLVLYLKDESEWRCRRCRKVWVIKYG